MHQIFMGPNGICAGWRLLMYMALNVIFSVALFSIVFRLMHIPRGQRMAVLSPGSSIIFEAVSLFVALLSAIIMRHIEHEEWGHYGLPLSRMFRGEFWLGMLWGMVGVSVIMLALWLGHFYAIDGLALHGMAIVKYGVLWGIAMLLVGFYEEFITRGYSLYTLASGIGFWPAALAFSILFFMGHLRNGGEDWIGLTDVFLFGIFACFTLWRTGSLWFAVGVHAAWDWGLTFLYSTPNSGLQATGQLLKVRFSGPAWLSGGSAGPEGSAINIVFDLLWFVIFALLFRKRKWVGMNERRLANTPVEPSGLLDSSALTT